MLAIFGQRRPQFGQKLRQFDRALPLVRRTWPNSPKSQPKLSNFERAGAEAWLQEQLFDIVGTTFWQLFGNCGARRDRLGLLSGEQRFGNFRVIELFLRFWGSPGTPPTQAMGMPRSARRPPCGVSAVACDGYVGGLRQGGGGAAMGAAWCSPRLTTRSRGTWPASGDAPLSSSPPTWSFSAPKARHHSRVRCRFRGCGHPCRRSHGRCCLRCRR